MGRIDTATSFPDFWRSSRTHRNMTSLYWQIYLRALPLTMSTANDGTPMKPFGFIWIFTICWKTLLPKAITSELTQETEATSDSGNQTTTTKQVHFLRLRWLGRDARPSF